MEQPGPGDPGREALLLRRGRVLEGITLGWNVAGIAVLAVAAVAARSVALAGFGLDSLIEIGASVVVLWELSGTGQDRRRRALRLIGGAFLALAAYLAVQSAVVPMTRDQLAGMLGTYSGVITLEPDQRAEFSRRVRSFLDRQPWDEVDVPLICRCVRSTRLTG
jgi:hypothetical protein